MSFTNQRGSRDGVNISKNQEVSDRVSLEKAFSENAHPTIGSNLDLASKIRLSATDSIGSQGRSEKKLKSASVLSGEINSKERSVSNLSKGSSKQTEHLTTHSITSAIRSLNQALPNVEHDIRYTKLFLQKQGLNNLSIWSHLTDVLNKIIAEEPENVVDYFEEYSRKVKQERLILQGSLREIFVPSPHLQHTKNLLLLINTFGVKEEPKEPNAGEEEEKLEPKKKMDLEESAFYFHHAGIAMPDLQLFILNIAIKKLAEEKSLLKPRFWGKILGTKQDYFVLECELSEEEYGQRAEEDEKMEAEKAEQSNANADVDNVLEPVVEAEEKVESIGEKTLPNIDDKEKSNSEEKEKEQKKEKDNEEENKMEIEKEKDKEEEKDNEEEKDKEEEKNKEEKKDKEEEKDKEEVKEKETENTIAENGIKKDENQIQEVRFEEVNKEDVEEKVEEDPLLPPLPPPKKLLKYKIPQILKPVLKVPITVPSEKIGEGLNRKIYFVSNTPELEWTELPKITPEQINISRQINVYLTGDLSSKIQTYPAFPGTEQNYLRAQIARISAATHISPLGFYKFGAGGGEDEEEEEEEIAEEEESGEKKEIAENPKFQPIPIKDLTDPSFASWVHHSQHILKQGRANWWGDKKKKSDEEEAEEEEVEEEEDEEGKEGGEGKESGPPLLTPLSEDSTIEDSPAWTVRRTHNYNTEMAAAVIKSNLWPGAYTFAIGKKFENIYFGWGHKHSPHGFSPALLPHPEYEYDLGPEIMEIQDPTVEVEQAWREAHKKKPPPTEEEEAEGEGEEDEEEEEDEDD